MRRIDPSLAAEARPDLSLWIAPVRDSDRWLRRGHDPLVDGFWRVKELEPRKNWAESSRALRAIRDPNGRGGVARGLWEWQA